MALISITQKLNEAGWPTDCFPDDDDGADMDKWVKLAMQPEPLTAKSNIAPLPFPFRSVNAVAFRLACHFPEIRTCPPAS